MQRLLSLIKNSSHPLNEVKRQNDEAAMDTPRIPYKMIYWRGINIDDWRMI